MDRAPDRAHESGHALTRSSSLAADRVDLRLPALSLTG